MVRQDAGNTKAERGIEWEIGKVGKGGFRRESELKKKKNGMELVATVALLYLDGKMWI